MVVQKQKGHALARPFYSTIHPENYSTTFGFSRPYPFFLSSAFNK